MTDGQIFYWLADNLTFWTHGAVMVLACLIIGLLHLVAIGMGEQ